MIKATEVQALGSAGLTVSSTLEVLDDGFRYSLTGHPVEQYWLADMTSEPPVDEVAALFEGSGTASR